MANYFHKILENQFIYFHFNSKMNFDSFPSNNKKSIKKIY